MGGSHRPVPARALAGERSCWRAGGLPAGRSDSNGSSGACQRRESCREPWGGSQREDGGATIATMSNGNSHNLCAARGVASCAGVRARHAPRPRQYRLGTCPLPSRTQARYTLCRGTYCRPLPAETHHPPVLRSVSDAGGDGRRKKAGAGGYSTPRRIDGFRRASLRCHPLRRLRTQMHDPCPHPAIILFDGECHLCRAWVAFVLRHDPRGVFRFAPHQSDAARRLLAPFGVRPDTLDSIALIAGPTLATCSDAIVQICSQLRFPWRLVSWLVVIPRPLRDVAYTWVARNRHRLSRQRDRCRMAGPEESNRLLR